MIVKNKDHHSADYSDIASYYRPGHADYTFDEKYGDLLSYTPVKEGYELQGWYTSLDGGKQVLPTTKMTIPWDHSLYAHWKKK